MPCYDPRDDSEAAKNHFDRIALVNDFTHNSAVAQLLCSLMKTIDPADYARLFNHIPGLEDWWLKHQARDKAKEGK